MLWRSIGQEEKTEDSSLRSWECRKETGRENLCAGKAEEADQQYRKEKQGKSQPYESGLCTLFIMCGNCRRVYPDDLYRAAIGYYQQH